MEIIEKRLCPVAASKPITKRAAFARQRTLRRRDFEIAELLSGIRFHPERIAGLVLTRPGTGRHKNSPPFKMGGAGRGDRGLSQSPHRIGDCHWMKFCLQRENRTDSRKRRHRFSRGSLPSSRNLGFRESRAIKNRRFAFRTCSLKHGRSEGVARRSKYIGFDAVARQAPSQDRSPNICPLFPSAARSPVETLRLAPPRRRRSLAAVLS